jgi:hypothetical protein
MPSSKDGAYQLESAGRPFPPPRILEAAEELFIPAPEVTAWVSETILAEDGYLFNPDHAHLRWATIGVVWTNVPYARQMNRVAGTAEMPTFRCGAWQKARQERQIFDWFGAIPDFLVTLDAAYAASVTDAVWCALIEHELYHCAQELDAFGSPKFSREGRPKFAIRSHDVEEFVGVVRRYGPGSAAGATARLVEAAKKPAEVAQVDIVRACGTCLLKIA